MNGIAIFPECKVADGSLHYKCEQGTCEHPSVTAHMPTGSFVAFTHSCVHMSLYPCHGHAVIAQFFFKLKGKASRLQTGHCEGVIDRGVCASALRDVGAMSCTHLIYQGAPVVNTVVPDMRALPQGVVALRAWAESCFERSYKATVETHTVWIIHKEGHRGGFSKHIDKFLPSHDHFGTLSVRIG